MARTAISSRRDFDFDARGNQRVQDGGKMRRLDARERRPRRR